MSVDPALEALARGMVIGVATDTVYGLAVDPLNDVAVAELFALKRRPPSSPLVVLVADLESGDRLATIEGLARQAVSTHWPGALTAIFDSIVPLSRGVGVDGTLALRVPDEPRLVELLAQWGPLAVTSANHSGEAPALNDAQAVSMFGAAVGVYLPGESQSGQSSTVVDFTGEPWKVLRQGPVEL